MEIDELTNGDCFAEYAAILKEPIRFSVVTTVPSEVFIVAVGDFFSLGKVIAEGFLSFSKVVPDDCSLRRALIEITKWNLFKQEMIKTVKASQFNTRHNYNSQLRGAPQIPSKQQDKSSLTTSFKPGFPEKYRPLLGVQEGPRITPNYISSYKFQLKTQEQKSHEIAEKQSKKNYLIEFEQR